MMLNNVKTFIYLLLVVAGWVWCVIACTTSHSPASRCADRQSAIGEATDIDGSIYMLFGDGAIYRQKGELCEFVEQYFDPDFLKDNYLLTDTVVFKKSGTILFPTKNQFADDFDSYSSFNDVFILRSEETKKFWTTITLLSPLAQTIQEYVALRKCIFNGTCSFRDNRVELARDPIRPSNPVMRFYAVAPTAGMITSKASMESTLTFFRKGDNIWFEGSYFIVGSAAQMPHSIADFENEWFNLAPGPRLVLVGGKLAVENKFGLKTLYRQPAGTAIPFPTGRWITVKVHLKYDDGSAGMVEVWQDGVQIINAVGVTLPSSNSVQTNIEIGITATSVAADMYVDNIRVSSRPF